MWEDNAMARPTIILIALLLLPAAFAIPCNIASWDISGTTLNIPGGNNITCENRTVSFIQGVDEIKNIRGSGDFIFINSTVLLHYDDTNFSNTGKLIFQESTLRSNFHPILSYHGVSVINNSGELRIEESSLEYLRELTLSGDLIITNSTITGNKGIISNGSNVDIRGLSSNLSFIVDNSDDGVIKDSSLNLDHSRIQFSDNFVMENVVLDNDTPTSLTFKGLTGALRNVSYHKNLAPNLINSEIDFVNTNSSGVNVADSSSWLQQFWTIFYNVTNLFNDLPISGVEIQVFNNDSELVDSDSTDNNGKAEVTVKTLNVSLSETINYNDHKIEFSKNKYRDEKEGLNITKSEKRDVQIQTTKGIIPETDCAFSNRFFCADVNPIYVGHIDPKDDTQRITFTVNATGNGNDITGIPFDFFVIAHSEISEVNITESESFNITVT